MDRSLPWVGDLPTRTPETAPFWDACNQRQFLLQRCPACQKVQYFYRAHCSHCWNREVDDFVSSGEGTVWTFSVVQRNNSAAFAGKVPYSVAVVELEGGVKVFGNVVDCNQDDIAIGMRVRVDFAEADGGQLIPVFVPA